MCRSLTRREMLRFTALAAATPVAAQAWRPARAFAQVLQSAVPMHLELVTLTDTSAIFTWFTGDPLSPDQFGRPEPIPANTIFDFGDNPLTMARVVDRHDDTPYHFVEVTGLEPGKTYFYRAESNGITATPSTFNPTPASTGVLTTLTPPPGKLLYTMCWANDVHIGEMTSGLAVSNDQFPGGGLPPGFAADPDNPYWRFMAEAAVDESRGRGAELLILNGDLTTGGQPVYLDEAKRIFDRFGTYGDEYFVTRGNHDRAHQGEAYQDCEPAGVPEYNDCLLDTFFPGGTAYYSFDRGNVHFVGLDTNDLTTGSGAISDEQFEWLEADLVANSGKPTFLFGHHPVSEESAATAIPPVVFTVNQEDAARLEGQVAEHSVVGVYSAHTHRNKRTSSPRSPGVPYIEVAATKEYPGGYALVRVYEGGYMVNFHKTKADPSRAWSERSRGEYLGLYPYYTLGQLSDRNFVVLADLSDATTTGSGPGGGASLPGTNTTGVTGGGTLPATGVASALGAAGAVAGTSLAARSVASRLDAD